MSFSQQAFTFGCASSSPWPSGGNDNDGLCEECAKLDLEQSFARAFALYDGARRGTILGPAGTQAKDGMKTIMESKKNVQ